MNLTLASARTRVQRVLAAAGIPYSATLDGGRTAGAYVYRVGDAFRIGAQGNARGSEEYAQRAKTRAAAIAALRAAGLAVVGLLYVVPLLRGEVVPRG